MISYIYSRTRKPGTIATLVCGCLLLSLPAQAKEEPTELREAMRSMIESARDQVFPSLVNIEVVTMNYWGGREHKGKGVGSGTIISDEGHIVTNQHVVDNGIKFKVTLSDKQEIPAELVGEDPLTDLAVLKLDLDKVDNADEVLKVANWGKSSELNIGDHVMAMGSPFALSRSVTLGIVSNTERVFSGGNGSGDAMQLERGQRTGLFTRWIQHDALINPGNSGGPLVNLGGEIIGVNALGGSAMGFAIPSDLARQVADSLIREGEVKRSFFGISLRTIDKTGFDEGVLINSVTEESPAGKAGLKAGDVILGFDENDIKVRFPEEVPPLMKMMADYEIGTEVKVRYQRDGEVAETKLVTAKLEEDVGDQSAFRGWGITGMEITERMADEWRLGSADGVMLSGLKPGGPAQLAEPPLLYGDVIVRVNDSEITDLKQFAEVYSTIMKQDPIPERVLIGIDRRGENLVTLIEPRPDENIRPPAELSKAWIGIATQPILKDLAEELGCSGESGFRITRIYPGTKAADSELKVGDVIVGLNGDPMQPSGLQDAGMLEREVRRLRIGKEANLNVKRCEESVDVVVSLEKTRTKPSQARKERNQDFEMTVREVTFFDRDSNRWDADVKGVIVDQIEPAGWSGLAGIHSGDLIQRIGDEEVKGLKSFASAMEKVTEEQPERVVMVVLRGARTYFYFVEPDWKPVIDEDESDASDED